MSASLIGKLGQLGLHLCAGAGTVATGEKSSVRNSFTSLRPPIVAYALAATLHRVGGPLDSRHSQPDTIEGVWSTSFAGQGGHRAPVAAMSEAANPKGSTVTADALHAATTPHGRLNIHDR
jgi:hypothetical protein